MAKRTGLGRGLGSLIPEGEPTASDTNEVLIDSPLRVIDITVIRPNSYQPRRVFDDETLQSLADSIAAVGVIQPIIVKAGVTVGEFELIAGERRWRAAQIAGLTSIPALIQDDLTSRDSLERAIVENLHRVDLNALEEAAAYQQLIDEFGLTHDEVAQRVGKNRTTVTNILRLLQLGPAAQEALSQGKISAGHARALLAVADVTRQAQLVSEISGRDLSVRATEEEVRRSLEPTAPTVVPTPPKGPILRPLPDLVVTELETLLENYLDTRVHVEIKGKNGKITIDFADLDDLERIYKAISE